MRPVALALSFSAVTMLAADRPPRLSQIELPISAPTLTSAVLGQGEPAVASNGDGYLVAWTDYRRGALGDIYAARLDSSGELLDPTGIRVSTHAYNELTPAVAWAGKHWVVAWNAAQDGAIRAVRISAEGELLDGEPKFIGGGFPSARLSFTSNGQLLLLTVSSGPGTAIVVDEDLRGLPTYQPPNQSAAASARGEFLVTSIRADGCANCVSGKLIGARLDANGRYRSLDSIVSVNRPLSPPAIASDGAQYLLAWTDGDKTRVALVSVEAQLVRVVLEFPALLSYRVIWAGSSYVLLWQDSTGTVQGRRIGSDGSIIDPEPLNVLPMSGPPAHLAAASNGEGVLAVWSAGDSYPYRYRNADIAGFLTAKQLSAPKPVLVSQSARRQAALTVAPLRRGYVAAWQESVDDQRSAIHTSVFSTRGESVPGLARVISAQGLAPAIATDGESYLVVWEDSAGLVARLVRVNEPVPDETTSLLSENGGDASLAWMGSFYLAVWIERGGVVAKRLDSDGAVLDPVPIRLSPVNRSYYFRPTVIAAGEVFFAFWSEGEGPCQITCGYAGRTGVFGTRVTTNGTVLDPGSISIFLGRSSPADAAFSGSAVLVVASGLDGVRARKLGLDGRADPEVVVLSNSSIAPTVAWNSEDFVIGTSEAEGADRLRVTGWRLSEGAALLGQVFSFSIETLPFGQEALMRHDPSPHLVAQGPLALVIGYTRVAPEKQFGGVPRGFLRVFQPASRRRGARP